MPTISLELTDEQLSTITDQATEKGRSREDYIRDVLGVSAEPHLKILRKRVKALSTGTPFTIKAVMATDWIVLPVGIRLSLGRRFYKMVIDGEVAGVKPTGKDPEGTMNYRVD